MLLLGQCAPPAPPHRHEHARQRRVTPERALHGRRESRQPLHHSRSRNSVVERAPLLRAAPPRPIAAATRAQERRRTARAPDSASANDGSQTHA